MLLNERSASQNSNASGNPFVLERNFRLNHVAERRLQLVFDGVGECGDRWPMIPPCSDTDTFGFRPDHTITVKEPATGVLHVRINDGAWRSVVAERIERDGRLTVQCNIDGVHQRYSAVIAASADDRYVQNVSVFDANGKTELHVRQPTYVALVNGGSEAGSASAASKVASPMPGVLDKLLVQPGDRVVAGQPVAVIIAMKMEHVLKAPRDGLVAEVCGAEGSSVAKGAAVVRLAEVEEAADEKAAARA